MTSFPPALVGSYPQPEWLVPRIVGPSWRARASSGFDRLIGLEGRKT